MQINLTELCTSEGKEKNYQVELEMESYQAPDGETYPLVDREPVMFHMIHTGKHVIELTGTARFGLMMPCSRCLEPVNVPFCLEFERTLDLDQTEAERIDEMDEQPYIKGYDLDVDWLVRDELLLNLPWQVLCKDDCKGICDRCGTNLNHGTCTCDRSSLDPRMSVIQDIFKQFKEV